MIESIARSSAAANQSPMSGPNAKTPEAAIEAEEKAQPTKPAPAGRPIKRKMPAQRANTVAAVRKATTRKRARPRQPTVAAKPKSTSHPAKPSVARKTTATAAKRVVVVPPQSAKKGGKVKVIRDRFRIPLAEYERIKVLKKKCLAIGIVIKKSEMLRAGLATLERLSVEDLKRVVNLVSTIGTGRPVGERAKQRE